MTQLFTVSTPMDDADIAEEYEIQSIPTLIAFKNGKEVGRTVGFRPKAQLNASIRFIEITQNAPPRIEEEHFRI